MRVFWALIVALIVAALGYPLVQSMRAGSMAEKARAEADRLRQIAERERASIESNVKKSLDATDAAAAADSTPATASPAVPPPAPSEPAPVSGKTEAQVGKGGVPDPTDTPLAGAQPPAPKDDGANEIKQTPPAPAQDVKKETPAQPAVTLNPSPATEPATPAAPPAETPAQPAGTPSAAPTTSDPPAAAATAAEPAEAPKIEKKDDGSLLVDDRFVVKGDGTAEKPYEISWEMLVSASETYDPRVGRKKLPGRIMMLDGKFVRLTGYVAYPLFVEQPRECLMMLNQWDGCCIGVPPTPYDAVEVRLKSTVNEELKMATYGVVEGKLGVKPYLAGDWLVGLYVMELGTLAAKQYNSVGQ